MHQRRRYDAETQPHLSDYGALEVGRKVSCEAGSATPCRPSGPLWSISEPSPLKIFS